MGLKAQVLALDNYSFTISSGVPTRQKQNRWVIHRTMGVNFDEFDLRVSAHLAASNFRISNPLPLLIQMRDKVAQLQTLQELGAPVIPSLILRGNLEKENGVRIQNFIRQSKSSRFILKTERGNHGLGVSLINGVDSLYSWLTTLHATKDQRYILQPFLENSREFRILLCGDQCLGLVEKKRKSKHAKNFKHNAGHTHFVPVNHPTRLHRPMLEWAQKIQTKMQSDFLAIDFLLTNKKIHLLEVGLCPGFIEFEKASKINVAKKVIQHLFPK